MDVKYAKLLFVLITLQFLFTLIVNDAGLVLIFSSTKTFNENSSDELILFIRFYWRKLLQSSDSLYQKYCLNKLLDILNS